MRWTGALLWIVPIFVGCTPQPAETETATAAGRGVARLSLHGDSIAIEYGRPALQGRDMLSQAQPGMVWRLGQNEATTLETTATLDFGGLQVAPGTYTLFAQLKSPDEWFLLINSATGLWGAGDYDPTMNVAVVPLLPKKQEKVVEVAVT